LGKITGLRGRKTKIEEIPDYDYSFPLIIFKGYFFLKIGGKEKEFKN